LATAVHTAVAQERYPSKPIQVVVPLSAGTTSDLIARNFAEKLAKRLGQSVVVNNRPGAGGTIAAASVAKATPDGYTILQVNSQHSLNPLLYDKLPYSLRDFAAIAQFGEAPSLVIVQPRLGVSSMKEFIALAKQKPGQLVYGSAGVGTTTHLGAAYFTHRAGIDLVHIPYKGAELAADMIGGRLDAIVVPVAFLLNPVREGKLTAIGVTSREALTVPIQVPSVEQAAGLPGFEYMTYYGYVAPANTPKPILQQLRTAIQSAAEDKDLREKFNAQAIFPKDRGPAEFDVYIHAELERMAPIVKATGAKAN
jgi:tripartite-type tricarboxylate transporter receptor subunit TctC